MKYSLSRFAVAPEHVKVARRAFNQMASAIQKNDPGLSYLVFQEPNRPVFVTLVSFQDDDAYRRHATSPHAARFARTISVLCKNNPTFVGLDLVTATTHARAIKAPVRPLRTTRRPRKRARFLGV